MERALSQSSLWKGNPHVSAELGSCLGQSFPVCVSLVKVLEGGWGGGSLYSDSLPPSPPKGVIATSGKFPASSFFIFFFLSFFPE